MSLMDHIQAPLARNARLIRLATWAVDLTAMTYPCPNFRTERTIIGLLGLLLLVLPLLHALIARYVAVVFGAYGFVVAAMQQFMGWDNIYEGTYVF